VEDGAQLVMRGYGEAVTAGTSGDLYVVVRVLPHKVFTRKGLNLYTTVNLKLTDMLLGKTFSLNLLGDSIDIQMPELAHMQQDIMVKHKGLKSGSHHGDLVVKVNIEMPKKLSSKERELVQELQKLGM
jgi:molecular chaperone DnaJ